MRHLLILVFLFAFISPVYATPILDADAVQRKASMQLLHYSIRSGRDLPQIVERAMRSFRSLDLDHDGLTADDDVQSTLRRQAKWLGSEMSRWIAKDLDADGVIAKAELRAIHLTEAAKPLRSPVGLLPKTKQQISQILDELVAQDLEADRDGDGAVTLAEAHLFEKNRVELADRRKSNPPLSQICAVGHR